MRKSYSEFNFDDDIELMNLTYKMNTGNFIDYEDSINSEKIDVKDTKEPKIGL